MTNYIFNKKGNFIVGLLLNAVLLIRYILSVVSYINMIRISDENPIWSDYSNQYKLMCIVSIICIVCVILSFVVLFVKKRQSALGVSLMYIMGLIIYIVSVITSTSSNIANNYPITNQWILLFLNLIFYLIIPIVTIILVAIYFKVPKKALLVISIILVVIPILYNAGYSIYTLLSFSNVDKMSTLLNIIAPDLPRILVILQLIISFRFKKMDINNMYSLNQQQLQEKKVSDNPDELFKYKELLDCGAITQKEFDDKKKELLNL